MNDKTKIKRAVIPKSASGIYEIRSEVNGKTYIGSAINFKIRKYHHFHDLEKKKHGNLYLQRHANKYGLSDLRFLILEFCSKEKLIEREQYYISALQPEFNICKIAGSSFGTHRSEESKEKMRGKNNPMYGISRYGKENSMYGKHPSEETRQKMSNAHKKHPVRYWLGKSFSKEHREKVGRKGEKNSFYGRHHSEETIQKLRVSRTGTHHTEETKQRMSEAHLLFYKTKTGIQMKQKLSKVQKGRVAWNKGKSLSEEQKRKMREARKRRKNVIGKVNE